MIGYVQKRLSNEHLNLNYPVVQWDTVSLMLILKCIIGFQSQKIVFKNAFSTSDIPSGDPVLIDLPRDFKSNGEQYDVVLRLNKILYGQKEAVRLWYEKLGNGLLDRGFVVSKVDTCMFMYMTVICVVCVEDCLF